MGLELLAIALAMSTFEYLIENRKVVVHCDNAGEMCTVFSCDIGGTSMLCVLSGGEFAIRKGVAKAFDHCQLVHSHWMHAARLNISIFIKRVASKDNVADLPSRKDFALLKAKGAKELWPVFAEEYLSEQGWDILQERWKLC
eukprot:12400970-Karenia_brevis.AAC.1